MKKLNLSPISRPIMWNSIENIYLIVTKSLKLFLSSFCSKCHIFANTLNIATCNISLFSSWCALFKNPIKCTIICLEKGLILRRWVTYVVMLRQWVNIVDSLKFSKFQVKHLCLGVINNIWFICFLFHVCDKNSCFVVPLVNLVPVSFSAYLTEWLHFLTSRIHHFQPLLTRAEVGQNHALR